jgi:hypothetical protein
MGRWVVVALLLSFVFLCPSSGLAQAARADSAAVLLDAAQRFQTEGRWDVAEALFHYITERFGDTPAGAQAMAALREAPAESAGRSGQAELMVWATTYGAWLGVAIPGALGADTPEPYGLGLLVGGPGGFLAGRALARSRPLSEGQVRAITFGSLWGSWQGYGLMELLDLGVKEHCELDYCYTEDPQGEDVFRALVVGGLAGTVAGTLLARKPIPAAVSTATSLGAFWGTWFGLAGGTLADLEGDGLLASTLIVGDVALGVAAAASPKWDLTRSQVRLISISGVLGGLAGAGIDLLVQPDDEKVAIGIPLVGSIVGLVVGAGVTSREAGVDRSDDGLGARVFGDVAGRDGPHPSVLRLANGRLTLGFPSPFATVVQAETERGLRFEPALGLVLFSSRF